MCILFINWLLTTQLSFIFSPNYYIKSQPMYSIHNLPLFSRVFLIWNSPDIGDFCSDVAIQYQGFCIGSVDSQEQDACDVIFAEGSQPITINGNAIHSFLVESFNQLEVEDRGEYVIGLQTVNADNHNADDVVTFQWLADGTPMTYSRLEVEVQQEGRRNSSVEYCVSMNSEDYRWSMFPCDDISNSRPTLCQIGKGYISGTIRCNS